MNDHDEWRIDEAYARAEPGSSEGPCGATVDEYDALRDDRNMWRRFARDSADLIGTLHEYTGLDGEASAAQIIERIQALAASPSSEGEGS